MIKDTLRAAMREKRRSMTADEVKEKSLRIRERLFTLDSFTSARTVCTYISAFNEPETMPVMKFLLSQGRDIAVPITHTDTSTLSLSYIHGMADLTRGAFGILEPKTIQPASEGDMDVFVIPGLAFGRNGNRMGFGKGYYDRLLSGTDAVKIGLCYEFQLFSDIPAEPHDIPMDFIVTEENIYAV